MEKVGPTATQKGGGETKKGRDESIRLANPETARASSGKNQSVVFIDQIDEQNRLEQVVQYSLTSVCCASILHWNLHLHLSFVHILELPPLHVTEHREKRTFPETGSDVPNAIDLPSFNLQPFPGSHGRSRTRSDAFRRRERANLPIGQGKFLSFLFFCPCYLSGLADVLF